MDYSDFNQRWVETDKGYIYGANVQPVKNILNQPLSQLPTYGGSPGMWVEITVPLAESNIDSTSKRILVENREQTKNLLWAGFLV